MIHIDLDTIERNILLETLVSYLSDLSVEIADTDSSEFRSQLKTKRDVLNKILDAVKQTR